VTDHAKIFVPSIFKYAGESTKDYERDFVNDTIGRCRMIQAETAFIWFLAGAFIVTLALSFMHKSTKHHGSMA